MFLKICGIQTPAEASAAIAAGATALGVLLGLTHAAEDKVTESAARDIIRALEGRVEAVLVTHLLDAERIAALAAAIGARAIQVHDDLPPDGMRRLRALAPGRRLIKAIHVHRAGGGREGRDLCRPGRSPAAGFPHRRPARRDRPHA